MPNNKKSNPEELSALAGLDIDSATDLFRKTNGLESTNGIQPESHTYFEREEILGGGESRKGCGRYLIRGTQKTGSQSSRILWTPTKRRYAPVRIRDSHSSKRGTCAIIGLLNR